MTTFFLDMLTHWFVGEGFLTFFQLREILMAWYDIHYNPPSPHSHFGFVLVFCFNCQLEFNSNFIQLFTTVTAALLVQQRCTSNVRKLEFWENRYKIRCMLFILFRRWALVRTLNRVSNNDKTRKTHHQFKLQNIYLIWHNSLCVSYEQSLTTW